MRGPGRRRPSLIPTLIRPLESPSLASRRGHAAFRPAWRWISHRAGIVAPAGTLGRDDALVCRSSPRRPRGDHAPRTGQGVPQVTAAAKAQAVEARSFRCYAGWLSRTGRRPS